MDGRGVLFLCRVGPEAPQEDGQEPPGGARGQGLPPGCKRILHVERAFAWQGNGMGLGSEEGMQGAQEKGNSGRACHTLEEDGDERLNDPPGDL